jgi:hypothetical protein
VGEVAALRLKLVRSRSRIRGRGHHLDAEATEVDEVSEGQVGEVEGGMWIRDED